jgi:hypothetical protein
LSKVYHNINNNVVTACINLDLSKAFDSIDHDLLIKKLNYYGIRGTSLDLLKSYLYKRSQTVKIRHVLENECRNFCSDKLSISRGVPQGSILGPLLFVIFLNDLSINMPCLTVSYADDTSLIINADSVSNLKIYVADILRLAAVWFTSNKLKLNIEKSNIIIFSNSITEQFSVEINNSSLFSTPNYKLLGITIDNQLNFSSHISLVHKKLNTAFFVIRYLRHTCNVHTLRMIYFGYFESNLRYGLIFWGNSTDTKSIFKLQKRVVRVIAGLGPRASCRDAFKSLSIMTLTNLLLYERIMYIYNYRHAFSKSNDYHNYHTRSNCIRPVFPRSERIKKSFQYNSVILYNNLTINEELIKNPRKFAKTLKNFLLNNVFYTQEEFLQRPVVLESFDV